MSIRDKEINKSLIEIKTELERIKNTEAGNLDELRSSILTTLSEYDSEFHHALIELQASLKALEESFSTTSSQFPVFTEEEIVEIKDSYAKWGQYGWTPAGRICPNQMYMPPQNQIQADETMLKFCPDTEIKGLFENILDHQFAMQNDVHEAIFAYENKQYKSCALVLFSLIDGLLISFQRKEGSLAKTTRRPTGIKAFNNLFNHFNSDEMNTDLISHFVYQSISSCLNKFFANGNDFIEEPDNINRNYVAHGMNKRAVEKTDCIKLFYLYHYILCFLWKIRNRK